MSDLQPDLRIDGLERRPWLDRLADASPDDLPLYGVPFAIKDNVDQACAFDPADPFARRNPYTNSLRARGTAAGPLRLGVPAAEQLAFFGDSQCQQLFEQNLTRWTALETHISTPFDRRRYQQFTPANKAATCIHFQ